MSRNKANVKKPWFGFKPFRFKELFRLLKPVLKEDKRFPHFVLLLDEPDDSEWNILVSLQEALMFRLSRIHDEQEFARNHEECDWLLNTMEARSGEEKVIKKKEEDLNVPDYDHGKEPEDDDLPF